MWRIESDLTDPGAPYDRRAATYDRLVRSRLYNRAVWSTSPREYEAFAAEAIAAADGPLLDAGAGSAAATAELHAGSGRESVLADRSTAMLERAAERIAAKSTDGELPPGLRLVQADVLSLPFAPGGFSTVLCMGLGHLFADLRTLRDALLAQVAPGGSLHLSCLVAETTVGTRYLRMLERAGEVAAVRTADDVRAALDVQVRVHGSMAYATIGR